MTFRKGISLASFVAATLVCGLRGAAADEVTLTGMTSLGTEYSYRGIVRTGPSSQWGVAGEIGGWRGEVWGNRPFRSGEPGELQSTLGYLWGVGERLQFELRGTHFWYTETFLRCIENAFRHFGGVTHTVVIDNLKAGVLAADWYDPELNPKLREFALHYGTTILPTKPATPRHKGKIESGR